MYRNGLVSYPFGEGVPKILRQAWLFAFKSLDLIILFKMNLLYYFALYYRNMDIDCKIIIYFFIKN